MGKPAKGEQGLEKFTRIDDSLWRPLKRTAEGKRRRRRRSAHKTLNKNKTSDETRRVILSLYAQRLSFVRKNGATTSQLLFLVKLKLLSSSNKAKLLEETVTYASYKQDAKQFKVKLTPQWQLRAQKELGSNVLKQITNMIFAVLTQKITASAAGHVTS